MVFGLSGGELHVSRSSAVRGWMRSGAAARRCFGCACELRGSRGIRRRSNRRNVIQSRPARSPGDRLRNRSVRAGGGYFL